MPNRIVLNPEDSNLKVKLYGDEQNVSLNVNEEGTVSITGNLETYAINALNVIGNVQLESNSVVALTGPIIVKISSVEYVEVNQSVSINQNISGSYSFTTDAIDISQFSAFSYYVRPALDKLSSVTVQSQISSTNSSGNFINSPLGDITINQSGGLATTGKYLRYIRLKITLTGSVTVEGVIYIYFQGKR